MKRLLVTPENPDGVQQDLTSEEEAVEAASIAEIEKQDEDMKKETEQKATDKASGNQKLKDLGLTDDEISALTGS